MPQDPTLSPAEVAELGALLERVYALAEIPAGPGLAAALAGIDADRVSPFGLTYLLQARFRQANHERGELLAAAVRILGCKVPAPLSELMRKPDWFAADEVRAALRLTRRAAKRLCELAWDLHRRLPDVLTAMRDGRLDEPRGRVFSTWTVGLSREHVDAVVAQVLPLAPELTTGELAAAIARLAIALDPEWVRRRYEAALRNRRVVGTKNPDGTGTLTGHDLAADDVMAACARLDEMARAAAAAGHRGRADHVRADLLVGLVTGRFTGMTDQQIIATLIATAKPEPATDHDDEPDDDADEAEPEEADDWADEEAHTEDAGDDDEPAGDDESTGDESTEGEPATGEPAGAGVDDDGGDSPATDVDAQAATADSQGGDEPADGPVPTGRSGIGRRGGLRLAVGLLTIAGADQRPGELLGWGPVHAELAGDLARRIGSWWCVLVDADGRPEAIVPVRRRPGPPADAGPPGPRWPGEVWLYTTRNHLRFVAKFAPMLAPGWADVAAEIIAKLETTPAGPPTGDPDARLPGARLRRWIQVRDGTCTFPGCRAPAHRADADHTTEHAQGGKTVDSDLAPACRHDHRLRHDGGWQVSHDEPGRVTWTSPLGHTYHRHRPPGLLDLPEPRPGAIDERDPEPPPCDPPPGADPESCLQQPPEPEPPPEPILTGRSAQDDDEIPPF